jgi:serine/threonine protein kinase
MNVLVDPNNGYSVKIIDFGCSRAVDRDTRMLTQGLGTVTYMAPEIFSNKDYSGIFYYGISANNRQKKLMSIPTE